MGKSASERLNQYHPKCENRATTKVRYSWQLPPAAAVSFWRAFPIRIGGAHVCQPALRFAAVYVAGSCERFIVVVVNYICAFPKSPPSS